MSTVKAISLQQAHAMKPVNGSNPQVAPQPMTEQMDIGTLDALLKFVGTPATVLDTNGQVLAASRSLAALAGCPGSTLHGRFLHELVNLKGADLAAVLHSGEERCFAFDELNWIHQQNAATSCHWLHYVLSPISSNTGQTLMVLAVLGTPGAFGEMHDVYNLVQSLSSCAHGMSQAALAIGAHREKQLHADKMTGIGQLAAGVAHELNNPVGYISSNLSTLHDYSRDIFTILEALDDIRVHQHQPDKVAGILRRLDDEVDVGILREDLDGIIEESITGANHIKKIVAAMRHLGRAGSAQPSSYHLYEGIDAMTKMVSAKAPSEIRIHHELSNIPPVHCIPVEVNQVILHLLDNARLALQGMGTITVRTGITEGRVWFEIEDDGCGIHPEHLSRIFEPFFTTREPGEGTGLGLAVAFAIISDSGGEITVRSTWQKGSLFRVTFPAKATVPESARHPDGPSLAESAEFKD